jgi:hypothetical protein
MKSWKEWKKIIKTAEMLGMGLGLFLVMSGILLMLQSPAGARPGTAQRYEPGRAQKKMPSRTPVAPPVQTQVPGTAQRAVSGAEERAIPTAAQRCVPGTAQQCPPVASPAQTQVPANAVSQSLSEFGSFTTSGSVDLPPEAAATLGTAKISWEKGGTPANTIPMGVWDTAFKIGGMTPAQINPSIDLSTTDLSKFGYLKDLSIGNLIKALPNLENTPIASIKPISDLVAKAIEVGAPLPSITTNGGLFGRSTTTPAVTIGDLVKVPGWGEIPMGAVGDLAKYTAVDLPGLTDTPLSNFTGALGLPASAVPGLAQLPIPKMPGYNLPSGYALGTFDSIRTGEVADRKVISGSDREPNAKCTDKNCNYIEIKGIGNPLLDGAQIVAGDTQSVRGGYGLLGAINGGREKAGMYPYGNALKETYVGYNAKTGTIGREWNFRYCQTAWFVDLGCTPYFIGGIPIGTLKEGSQLPLLLGSPQIPMQVKLP